MMKEKFEGLVEQLLGAGIFLEEAIEILERSMIGRSLERSNGNQSAAAKQLGIHRNTLQRKMVEYSLANGRAHVRRKTVAKASRLPRRKASAA
jgi:Fis family transcriptional regulator, factor for inversion stimulation protein